MSSGRRSQGAADGMEGRRGGARVSARIRVGDGTARLLSWAHLARVSAEYHPHTLDAPTAAGRKDERLGANPPSARAPFFAQGKRTCRLFENLDRQLEISFALARLESSKFFLNHAVISSAAGEIRRSLFLFLGLFSSFPWCE